MFVFVAVVRLFTAAILRKNSRIKRTKADTRNAYNVPKY